MTFEQKKNKKKEWLDLTRMEKICRDCDGEIEELKRHYERRIEMLKKKLLTKDSQLRKSHSKVSRLNKGLLISHYVKTYSRADINKIKFTEKELKDLIKRKKIGVSLIALFFIWKKLNKKKNG